MVVWLRIKQMADQSGLSRYRIRSMIDRGILPGKRLGGERLVRSDDFFLFLRGFDASLCDVKEEVEVPVKVVPVVGNLPEDIEAAILEWEQDIVGFYEGYKYVKHVLGDG